MIKKLFLGLDISTTSAKALLIDQQGQVVATANTPLSLQTPFPLWSEQHPEDWWQGMLTAIRQVLTADGVIPEAVSAVGLTGQMHGLVMLDSHGQVLRPAILWNDQRTAEECDLIRERIGKERLIQLTGNDALTGFTAPKVLWVQRHEPEIYQKCRHILLPKDYIRYRLTGVYATDKAGAAGTLLMDVQKRDWSEEVLKALEIPRDWLPETYEGTHITGEITQEIAGLTGLPAGIAVVGGGGDQAAGAVGVGAVEPGIISLVLGTSGVVFASTTEPFIEKDGLLHAFCHALPGAWHLMGVMLSAAGSLQWYHDTFTPDMSFDQLVEPAGSIPPGAEGLYFLPYLTGERTPHPDPFARGGFIGLTRTHTRHHLTRAVLEGVAFGLKDGMELVKGAGLEEIRQIRVSGGGAKSPIWRQILADILDAELVTVNTTEGGAFGAALLAAVGAGNWPDVPSACASTIRVIEKTTPNAELVPIYRKHYQIYRALYPALKSINQKISVL